jgi:hypothetical protein
MGYENYQWAEGLVTRVVDTARRQGFNVAPATEAHIIQYCAGALEKKTLTNRREVVIGAAGLVAGGYEMSEQIHHSLITPEDVDEGYKVYLRRGLVPDMTCTFIITDCMRSTILEREPALMDEYTSFRRLVEAVEEL